MVREITPRPLVTRKVLITVLVLIFGCCSGVAAGQPEHTRVADLPPLKLTYSDLSVILTQIRNLASTANVSVGEDDIYIESIRFGNDSGESIDIPGDIRHINFSGAPEVSTDVWYRYELRELAPIARIDMRLGDYSRSIEVTGGSLEQAEAIIGHTQRLMDDHATWFGGSNRRLTAVIVIFILLNVGWIYSAARNMPFYITITLLLIAYSWMIVTFALPLGDMFPGTAVYLGSISWVERNMPALTVLALVFAVLGLPVLQPLLGRMATSGSEPTVAEGVVKGVPPKARAKRTSRKKTAETPPSPKKNGG